MIIYPLVLITPLIIKKNILENLINYFIVIIILKNHTHIYIIIKKCKISGYNNVCKSSNFRDAKGVSMWTCGLSGVLYPYLQETSIFLMSKFTVFLFTILAASATLVNSTKKPRFRANSMYFLQRSRPVQQSGSNHTWIRPMQTS